MSIAREEIKITAPTDYEPFTKFEWTCPQCGGTTHGDSRSDSIFEIRHDPLCISCRVKNGEFTFDGSKYTRVKNKPTGS